MTSTYPQGVRLSGASRLTHTGTEPVFVWTGRTTRTADRVPVIFAHGLLGSAASPTWRSSAEAADDLAPIAAWGHPVIIPNLAGPATWGNPASIAAVDAAIDWAAATYGTRTDRVVIAGESMGAMLAFNWAWRNTARVAALWARVPCVSAARARETEPFRTTMDTAYGGEAGWLAAQAEHDPWLNTGRLRPLRDRMSIWATTDDEYFPLEDAQAFARRAGTFARVIPGDHQAGHHTPSLDVARWIAATVRRHS